MRKAESSRENAEKHLLPNSESEFRLECVSGRHDSRSQALYRWQHRARITLHDGRLLTDVERRLAEGGGGVRRDIGGPDVGDRRSAERSDRASRRLPEGLRGGAEQWSEDGRGGADSSLRQTASRKRASNAQLARSLKLNSELGCKGGLEIVERVFVMPQAILQFQLGEGGEAITEGCIDAPEIVPPKSRGHHLTTVWSRIPGGSSAMRRRAAE